MPNKPLISIGRLIDVSFNYYVEHFREFIRISAWLCLPLLFTILGVILFDRTPVDELTTQLVAGNLAQIDLGSIVYGLFLMIVNLITGGWILASMILLIKKHRENLPVSDQTISNTSWKLMPNYLFIYILKTIATIAPLLLLVPGVLIPLINAATVQNMWISIVGLVLIFAGSLAALILVIHLSISLHFSEILYIDQQQAKGLRALKASRALVRGRWFSTMFRLLIPYVLVAIASLVYISLLTLGLSILVVVLLQGNTNALAVVSSIVGELIFTSALIVTTPLYILFAYFLYESLKETR